MIGENITNLRKNFVAVSSALAKAKAEIERLRVMAYQPANKHNPGCDCIQCVPF